MTRQRVLKLANVSAVTDGLWVGGDLEVSNPQLALAQLVELDEAGVTDIVDLRLEWNDEHWVTKAKPHLRYRWLGVDDAGQQMPDEWFATGTSYVLAAMAREGRVLVNCHMGINRGPSMGYAVLLALGWDPIEALDRIRGQRPIAHVGYAEDALDWWLRKNGASNTERTKGRRRIREWRRNNHLDVGSVIRKLRIKEQA
jgi:dual specificity phosphatase 3